MNKDENHLAIPMREHVYSGEIHILSQIIRFIHPTKWHSTLDISRVWVAVNSGLVTELYKNSLRELANRLNRLMEQSSLGPEFGEEVS